MIVYGDLERCETTARLIAELDAEVVRTREGQALHRVMAAGELTQGVLDAEFHARGEDDWGDLQQRCARLSLAAARLLRRTGGDAEFRDALKKLSDARLPETVTIRVPEGFAFYALHPALYASAAHEWARRHDAPVVVIGLRSIGTSLAAIVAEVANSAELPVTVRPVGHPFRRALQIGPRLERFLLDRSAQTEYALVDEGPGLSGSSFGAAADWLEDNGVSAARIHFFPGHGGDPGPRADPRHRERWRRCSRSVVPLESLAREEKHEPWRGTDVGGGRWRTQLFPDVTNWPPANPTQERRKFVSRAQGRHWLAKFAGFGAHGEVKLARARRLDRAGFIPAVRGLQEGFLIQEWLLSARPLPLANVDRKTLLDTAARYLAFLENDEQDPHLPSGASPARLLEMARFNVREKLGDRAASRLDRWNEDVPRLSRLWRPVATDNRMHAWEWLALPDGTLRKADALDHCRAHDCIGPQDLAWDLAGAAVESDLTADEHQRLEDEVARCSDYRPRPGLVEFCRLCYLAFQMGYYVMASQPLSDPAEVGRLDAAAERYAQRLERSLTA